MVFSTSASRDLSGGISARQGFRQDCWHTSLHRPYWRHSGRRAGDCAIGSSITPSSSMQSMVILAASPTRRPASSPSLTKATSGASPTSMRAAISSLVNFRFRVFSTAGRGTPCSGSGSPRARYVPELKSACRTAWR